jgi:hypothetical protein
VPASPNFFARRVFWKTQKGVSGVPGGLCICYISEIRAMGSVLVAGRLMASCAFFGAVSGERVSMPSASKRTSAELVHTNQDQMAGILGVASSSLKSWRVIATFPKRNESGQMCIRDVCYWYLANRASKDLQRQMCEALAAKLGLRVVESGKVAEDVADPMEARPSVLFKTPMERLEYQTKLAKFERELGDVVRIRHIEPVLTSFIRKIRNLLESVAKTTGHPVGAGLEKIIGEVVAELHSISDGASRDSGE